MLRAVRKLMTKVLCPNMKKSRNQRRLVIVVALVGVYFLGRHSSSLGISRSGEEEKRILRGPFRYSQHQDNTEQKETAYIAERVRDHRTNARPLRKVGSDSVDVETAEEVLQKLADTVVDLAQGDDVAVLSDAEKNNVLDIRVEYDYDEEEQETINASDNKGTKSSNKQTAGQEKDPLNKGIDQNKDGKRINKPTIKLSSSESPAKMLSLKGLDNNDTGIDKNKNNQNIEPKPSQMARNQNIKGNSTPKLVVKSTGPGENKARDNIVTNTVKPKPTVLTSTLPKAAPTQGSKVASKQYASTNSAVKPLELASSRFAGGIKVQEILKDKLFVLKSKMNVEDQFLKMLKTSPYSMLLKRTATSSPANNSTYKSKKFRYNKELSDSLPLLRDLPDNRDIRCKTQRSTSSKLEVSVISVVHSESVSVVLRMLVSVLHRTPSQALKEVLLVMDVPTWDKGEIMMFYSITTKFPIVKIINATSPSMGLANCMNTAAKRATGQVLAFVSPQIEFTNNWHIPLLAWLSDHPNNMVVPMIDTINYKTLEYSKSTTPVQVRGGFTWALAFRWKEIPDVEKQRRQNLSIELRTPVYNGAIMLVRSVHYNNMTGVNQAIAGFDEKGVALELSMKQWMCGGMLQTIPCSRVGYLYSTESPVNIEQLKNRQIIAESLMDNYKKHFYGIHTHLYRKEILQSFGEDIQATQDLRKKLGCNSFKWYLDEVYYDKKEPRIDSQYGGLITQARGTKLCVDGGSYIAGRQALCRPCYNGSFTQRFELDLKGKLTFDEDLILGQRKPKPSPGDPVEVLKKRTTSNKQEWMYMNKKTFGKAHGIQGELPTWIESSAEQNE
ncbi:polypeptide N-acetylgalactosaminyltransferase 11-like isoform X3 [Dysidea avara]|uniref:polypeptide N-acetylgalactosaminyltransferase 11-like isoform X3 n=1 Tax=Dysidea avara TaxID=196820 RepID=UPI00332E4DC9